MTDDPLGRDRHPMRPDHPDFWRLSEIVLQFDAQADWLSVDINDIVKQSIDLPSATYMALQRALRIKQASSGPSGWWSYLSAAWLEGLVAGIRFEQRRLPKQRKPSEES